MKRIYEAFVAAVLRWLSAPPIIPVPIPAPLTPGECECGHNRCSHLNGVGRCNAWHPPDEDFKESTGCACQVYIKDDDDDDDDPPPEPDTPSVDELERLMRR